MHGYLLSLFDRTSRWALKSKEGRVEYSRNEPGKDEINMHTLNQSRAHIHLLRTGRFKERTKESIERSRSLRLYLPANLRCSRAGIRRAGAIDLHLPRARARGRHHNTRLSRILVRLHGIGTVDLTAQPLRRHQTTTPLSRDTYLTPAGPSTSSLA